MTCLNSHYEEIFGVFEKQIIGVALFLATAFIIICKHRTNIERIKNGKEMHFSYLWNKEEEIERLGASDDLV